MAATDFLILADRRARDDEMLGLTIVLAHRAGLSVADATEALADGQALPAPLGLPQGPRPSADTLRRRFRAWRDRAMQRPHPDFRVLVLDALRVDAEIQDAISFADLHATMIVGTRKKSELGGK